MQAERAHPSVSVAGVTLDISDRVAVIAATGSKVVLTPLQAALLAHLMSRPGQVCSRDDLMRQALGYPIAVGSRTVDVHVATLRTKLAGALSIRAVRGVGYTLDPVEG
ncbi:MAG: winged helix-turn-helix domain-containing protein [Jiangellaceae bacterium]